MKKEKTFMFKNEVKGHGTIKKLRTGAVVSVLALTGLGGVVSANADETTSAGNTEVVAKDAKSETVTEAKAETVTEKQVADAKVEANKANQALTAQEGVVTGAEKAVADNENTVADLNSQITEVEKVTPEVVEQAKSEQAKAKDTLDQATAVTTSAENSLTDATNKVEAQKGVVSEAESNVEKTASAVADAEKKVDALSATTDTAKLDQDVKDLTAKVAEDTANVKSAKDSLDAAKLVETNKDQAIKDAKSAVDTATKTSDSTKKALDTAKSTEALTTKGLEDSKKALEVAKAGVVETTTREETRYNVLKSSYSPVLTKDYIEALKALANGTGTSTDVRKAIRKAYTDENGVGANSLREYNSTGTHAVNGVNVPYGSEDGDTTEIVDFQNLTTEQRTNLSIYAASILNELRAKIGTTPLQVSETSVLLVGELDKKERYYKTTDAWSGELTGATYNNTLKDNLTQTEKEQNITERSTSVQGSLITKFSSKDAKKYTMADLKQLVYQGIVNTLMGANENSDSRDTYSSALYMLGLKDSEKSNVGVSLAFEYAQGYPNSYIATFVLSPIVKKTETKTIVNEQEVSEAQSNYDKAVQDNTDAKSKVATAEASYTSAKDALATAKKQLADLESGTVDIPALEKALADAQTQLEADQASLQSAKETLALAKASATDKAKALEVAKTELAEAKKSSETAKGVLAKEKETLEVLSKAVEVAQVALTDARTKQEVAQTNFNTASAKADDLATKLANKETVLADLNSKLAEAKAKSSVLRAELETAKELYETLKKDSNSKNAEYLRLATLKAEQDKAEAEAKRLQALKEKADVIIAQGGVPTPVLDEKGDVIDYIDGKKATTAITPTKVMKQAGVTQVDGKTTYSRVERAKSLPNTGSQESLLGLLGASVLLGLGYTGKRKKTR